MIDRQQFFEFKNTKGTLTGYKLPDYMEGANIPGYHFHFLPDNVEGGGHIIAFDTENIKVEIDILNSFSVITPQHSDFKKFDFKKDRANETEDVESGSKKE